MSLHVDAVVSSIILLSTVLARSFSSLKCLCNAGHHQELAKWKKNYIQNSNSIPRVEVYITKWFVLPSWKYNKAWPLHWCWHFSSGTFVTYGWITDTQALAFQQWFLCDLWLDYWCDFILPLRDAYFDIEQHSAGSLTVSVPEYCINHNE